MPLALETVVRVVHAACFKDSRIKPAWSGVGTLIDALKEGDETEQAVAVELCQWMHRHDNVTRSCYVRPFMQLYCASREKDVKEDTTNDDRAVKRDQARRGRERTARHPRRR